MRAITNILIVILLAMMLAVITKPTDADCLRQATAHYAGDEISALVGNSSRIVFVVEDHTFYKTIHYRFTGHWVADVIFGQYFY